MSLVGNLEDLNLGEILQIVSLSRKSGLLHLRSGAERGRIVLVGGQVRGGGIEGEPASLRDILVDGGFLGEGEYKLAVDDAATSGTDLLQLLAERAGLEPERLEALRREQVESAVIGMLGWRTGEFSFEVRGEAATPASEMLLTAGINAQYLAIEATRLGDEAPAGAAGGPAPAAPVFSGEDAAAGAMPEPPVERSPAPARAVAPAPAPRRLAERPRPDVPLVVVDRSLHALEWLKGTLDGCFQRIHAFQDTETGVARVRQYLARLVRPAVLLGVDPENPAGTLGLARRLQRLAPGMPVLLFCDPRSEAARRLGAAAALPRPAEHELAQRQRWSRLEEAGRELRRALEPWAYSAGGEGRRLRLGEPADPLEEGS